jgi:hypothetical protein
VRTWLDPPDNLAGRRAAVLLNYVLRPAGFIGHCNVRSSLNVAGAFRTVQKTLPTLRSPEDLKNDGWLEEYRMYHRDTNGLVVQPQCADVAALRPQIPAGRGGWRWRLGSRREHAPQAIFSRRRHQARRPPLGQCV